MAKRKRIMKTQDQNNPNQSDDSADNFGLPDIEYKPLDRPEPEVAEIPAKPEERIGQPVAHDETEEPVKDDVDYFEDDDEQRSNAPVIIIVLIALVVAAAVFVGWKYWYVPRAEKAKMELAQKEAEAQKKKDEDARIAKEKEEAEQKRLADEAAAKAKPEEGSIETLSARTQAFYVVLASDIDDDLIMDYAKRLSAKGVSTKIVPPFGTTKFYRLAMGDMIPMLPRRAEPMQQSRFRGSLWVIKY